MKHFILLILFGFFIVINAEVKVEEKQTLNEYKIEQLQKGIDELKKEIDELKKDVDDTKEKKLENKKDNESLDKRIGDINGSVDRFGIIAGFLGLLITIGLAISGWLGYTKAKTESKEVAKEEAEKVTKDWINNEANKQLNGMITKLEDDAKEKIAEAVQNAKDEIKQQSKSEELFAKGYNAQNRKEYNKAEEYYLKAIDAGNNDALFNLGILYAEQKEHNKAEEYYLKAIDVGNNDALNNLGVLYKEQKKYLKAEEYYLKAIDVGNNGSLINLGNLYNEQKEYEKAEEYYLKAIESGVNDALNSLSWMYFTQGKEKNKSLELIQKSYKIKKEYANTHTFAVVLLWNEEFSKSYEKFEEWMEYENALESLADISDYINLLISKGQYYKAKEYFENEKYQLKDKLKPIWYALITLMQDEFPNEIKKMGSELQESVDDILKTIEELKEKYKI